MAYVGKDGTAELQGMIATLKRIPGLAKQHAPEIADVVGDELRKTADAGTTPFGQPWQVKKDGGRPMENAADAVKCAAVGSTILAVVKGPEARHHKGTARGGIPRQLLPVSNRIPKQIDAAVREVLNDAFEDLAKDPKP